MSELEKIEDKIRQALALTGEIWNLVSPNINNKDELAFTIHALQNLLITEVVLRDKKLVKGYGLTSKYLDKQE